MEQLAEVVAIMIKKDADDAIIFLSTLSRTLFPHNVLIFIRSRRKARYFTKICQKKIEIS